MEKVSEYLRNIVTVSFVTGIAGVFGHGRVGESVIKYACALFALIVMISPIASIMGSVSSSDLSAFLRLPERDEFDADLSSFDGSVIAECEKRIESELAARISDRYTLDGSDVALDVTLSYADGKLSVSGVACSIRSLRALVMKERLESYLSSQSGTEVTVYEELIGKEAV